MIELYCGDCIEVMKKLPSKSIDMVMTDIPYGEINKHTQRHSLRSFDKKDADIVTFALGDFMKEVCRIVKGSVYIFCSTEQISFIRSYMESLRMLTRVIVWEKTNPSPVNGEYVWLSGIELCCYGKFPGATYNQFCENTVIRCPTTESKVHPTQKPIQLIKKLILASTNGGDTVLDPCMGSGTTGIACINTGRKFMGIELNEKYFNISKQRIETAERPLF